MNSPLDTVKERISESEESSEDYFQSTAWKRGERKIEKASQKTRGIVPNMFNRNSTQREND